MKREQGLIILLVTFFLMSFTLEKIKKIKIYEGENVSVIRDGQKKHIDEINFLLLTDTIEFYHNGRLLFEVQEGEKNFPYKFENMERGKYDVKALLKMKKPTDVAYNTVLFYGKTKIGFLEKSKSKDALGIKATDLNDSIYNHYVSIEQRLQNYISNPSSATNDYLVELYVNYNDSICTVVNNSDVNLYVDILNVGKQYTFSILSPLESWKSDVIASPKSKVEIYSQKLDQQKGNYILVCSPTPYSWNSIMKISLMENSEFNFSNLKTVKLGFSREKK